MNCTKHDECGRLAYKDGLCIPHIKGWTPGTNTLEQPTTVPATRASVPRKRTPAKKATTKKAAAKKP